MAKDTGEEAPLWADPARQTGISDDKTQHRYWDTTKNEYVTVAAGDTPDDLSYYRNEEGNFVSGTTPENKYLVDDGGMFQEGVDPNAVDWSWVDDGGLSFGGGGTPVATPRPPTTPTGGGGGTPPTGGGGGTLPPSTRPDLPQPDGGPVVPWTGEQEQADTSWDWDAFAPKRQGDAAWGGYDEDYQAFERYQPGMDSPWGMPDIEGGNKEFYQQQFANLLRDDQGYRNRARSAQERAQFAQDNPFERAPTDWSWANGGEGLKEVITSQGRTEGTPSTWQLNQRLNSDMSNADMISGLTGVLSDDDIFGLGKHQDYIDSGDFSSRESVQDWVTSNPYRNDKKWSSALGQVGQNLYTPQGGTPGTNVPAGYALPI